jgi:phosphatidylglycerophosphatase A
MIQKIVEFILTGLYFGKVKFMPGTSGTVLAVIIYIYLLTYSLFINILILLIFFIFSFFLLEYSSKKLIFKQIDDKSIVIDEIIGYLSFMIFFEATLNNIILGFILFRFFDIVKPYPISIADSRINNSFGVLFDDLLAALYSSLFLYIYNYVF